MKLQHSLGGLENLGPVNLEKKVFVSDWEKRIFGIHTVMMAESAHLSDALPRYPVDEIPTAFKEPGHGHRCARGLKRCSLSNTSSIATTKNG